MDCENRMAVPIFCPNPLLPRAARRLLQETPWTLCSGLRVAGFLGEPQFLSCQTQDLGPRTLFGREIMCEDPKMIGVVNFRGPQLTGKVAAPDAPLRSKPVFVPVATKLTLPLRFWCSDRRMTSVSHNSRSGPAFRFKQWSSTTGRLKNSSNSPFAWSTSSLISPST